jgi:hypothetical protein
MSLKRLANRLDRLNRKLPYKVNDIAQKVAFAVLEGIVDQMPVDTSQAVSTGVR